MVLPRIVSMVPRACVADTTTLVDCCKENVLRTLKNLTSANKIFAHPTRTGCYVNVQNYKNEALQITAGEDLEPGLVVSAQYLPFTQDAFGPVNLLGNSGWVPDLSFLTAPIEIHELQATPHEKEVRSLNANLFL